MSAKQWIIILAAGIALTCIFHFSWFNKNQHVAIWLEGIALVAIFGLDFFERKTQEKEHEKQHSENLKQMEISQRQLEASHRPCLTVPAKLRDPSDVILELHESNSTQMLSDIDGNLGILNVGSGPAIN